LGNDWRPYNQTYDPKDKLSHEQQQRVIDFCKLVSHASDADFNAHLDQFIDLDELVRFLAVEVWLSTLDSILTVGQNYYLYLSPKGHRFQFFPWDLDHSFGQFAMAATQEERENLAR
jgi:spore coat protein CotH